MKIQNEILILDRSIDGNNDTQIIFVNADRTFIGTLVLQYKNRRSANISQLYVSPNFRRIGIGTKLINECFRISKESHCETIGLVVEKGNNDAFKFYEKIGFVLSYQYDDGDVLMCMALN